MTQESLSKRFKEEQLALEEAYDFWHKVLLDQAKEIDSNAEVSGRIKSHRSIIGKAYRNPGNPRVWEDFGDLVGLKAIFPTTRGVESFSEWLLEQQDWSPVLDDKKGAPSELKYQAKQFDLASRDITDSKGKPIKIEVQVRTAASDAWYVVDHRLKYKGIVELPDELKRKLNRLIVLTELFDEEIEAVLSRQAELPEYAAARLYTDLVHFFEVMFTDQIRASRPEGLFELLLSAYEENDFDSLTLYLRDFFSRHKNQLLPVIENHHIESANYVEHRDWLYYEPETLLIAERSLTKPAMLANVIRNSDFEFVISGMMTEFQDRVKSLNCD